jgi:surfactin synthase thioesterase subunit
MLPFAGASAFAYAPLLPASGDPSRQLFRQFSLPGRGERTGEPLVSDLDLMARDLFATLARSLGPGDVVYGHSMGALLALLVVRLVRAHGTALPCRLVVSGMRAPSRLRPRTRHTLPRPALKDEMRRLGGTPAAILDDDTVFDYFEPQIRADLAAVETYRHRAEPPLPVPLTVLVGADDEMDLADAAPWQDETIHPVDLRVMAGGHFFIFRNAEAVRAVLLAAGTASAA